MLKECPGGTREQDPKYFWKFDYASSNIFLLYLFLQLVFYRYLLSFCFE